MEPERDEVYERIPWETLEKKGGDRQWLVYAVAGAVTLGALAYSFTRNQPSAPVAVVTPSTLVGAEPTDASVAPDIASAPASVPDPVVVTEADLFAVDPERLIDRVAAHAEWLAVEFVGRDSSDQSRQTLMSLLPSGIELPETTPGTQVFVDWVAASEITQTGPSGYVVEVLVRSLLSTDGSGFVRQSPQQLTVAVSIDETGEPMITALPEVAPVTVKQLESEAALIPVEPTD